MDAIYRQWKLIRLIPRGPNKIDSTQLVERLADAGITIDRRSIQRDLLQLATQFPLDHDDFKPRGWWWRTGAPVTSLPGMDVQTAFAFKLVDEFLRPLLPALLQSGLQNHVREARNVLGKASDAPLAKWPDLVRVVPRGVAMHPPEILPGVMKAVYEALLAGRQLEVDYRKRDAPESKANVFHPVALVFRDNVPYAVGMFADYKNGAHIPLHRISSAKVLTAARRKPGFTLDEYLKSSAMGFLLDAEEVTLRVRFAASAAPTVLETPLAKDQTVKIDADGNAIVSARVKLTVDLRAWLLGFGATAEVLAPKKLRDQMRDAVEAMVAKYARASESDAKAESDGP